MKLFTLFALTGILFSCGIFKKGSSDKTSDNKTVIAGTLGDVTQSSDPVDITNAVVEGNTLKISVSYSGGCETHAFDLVGSLAIMKSLPAKRSIKLIHSAKGDACRQMIEETVEFDISNFAYEKTAGSTIILLLDGYKEEITYTYQ